MENKNDIVNVISLDSGILHVSLNRPDQLNALNTKVLHTLSVIFEQIRDDTSVRAILLTGEGKGFCAGADIKELVPLSGQSGMAFARLGQLAFRRLEIAGKPSLAAIHGFALGGGCELAMAATLRIAANNAVFGQPEIKLGVIPGFGGTQRLSRLIGKGRALEMCLTGRRFTAEEAWRWGWLNEMAEPDALLKRAKAILKELVQLPAVALNSVISVIHEGYDLSLEDACELEAAHFGLCCTTSDKQEGVTAFLEKRSPVFRGETIDDNNS